MDVTLNALLQQVNARKSLKGVTQQLAVGQGQNGRNCYAFSDKESIAFMFLETYVNVLVEHAKDKGMQITVRTDDIGNKYVRLIGTDPSLPVIAFGSHLDSVKNGGRFDGVVGVAGGFHVLEAIVSLGQPPKRSVELIVWRAGEFSPRTGYAHLGSAVATGAISWGEFSRIEDKLNPGRKLVDSLKMDGWNMEKLQQNFHQPSITADQYGAYIELHIEQGAVLEDVKKDIGVVCHIGGIKRWNVKLMNNNRILLSGSAGNKISCFIISGGSDQIGSTPMCLRHDALWAAANALRDPVDGSCLVVSVTDLSASGCTKVPSLVKIEVCTSTKRGNCVFPISHEGIGMTIVDVVELDDNFKVEYSTVTIGEQIQSAFFAKRLMSTIFDLLEKSSDMDVATRLTFSDFKLDANGSSFQIDLCEVDHREGQKLANEVINGLGALSDSLNGMVMNITSMTDQLSQSINQGVACVIRGKAKQLGFSCSLDIPSFSDHDARNMAATDIPTGMIFVPSRGGLSHCKDEYTSPEQIEAGVKVLVATVWELANQE